MSDPKIIWLKNHKKQKKSGEILKMLFLAIVIGAVLGLVLWNQFVENYSQHDFKIPESKNITFNAQGPLPLTTAQVAAEFERSDGKPILLYIYATWCQVCTKNFPAFNELTREFQNTDLQIMTLAIDRNQDAAHLQNYLNKFGDIYFQPRFLAYKEGFLEFLQKRHIRYNNRLPFTVLISRDGEVIAQYSGIKRGNYLRNKIVKELYL